MSIQEFKKNAEKLIDGLNNLVETMPQKGNTAATCQKTLLRAQINELEYVINGTIETDVEAKTAGSES